MFGTIGVHAKERITMKKLALAIVALLAVASNATQNIEYLRSRRAGLQLRHEGKPLEPVMPFAEAVEKAKAGNAQGYYQLAVHYFKGNEIDRDFAKGRASLRKAKEKGYANAILIDAMIAELESIGKGVEEYKASMEIKNEIRIYIGVEIGTRTFGLNWNPEAGTNELFSIRSEYEKAFAAGANEATNQMARIDARIKAKAELVQKQEEEKKAKIRNAKLVEGLL